VTALQKICERYTTGCITNNVAAGHGAGMQLDQTAADEVARIMEQFDFVIESSKVGIRKPDPRIYQLACEQASVPPERVIYLDDLGVNLKPAKDLGMTTIKVTQAEQAITELESLLQMRLR
ncbi:MAG TPA: HAD-IA family hydrolase, partial [Pseudomonadales bacterium]|nr:HAD-IA family hydrolase [Pseudomonadales bacterium]